MSDVVYNKEVRARIRLALAAYAYEFEDAPIMGDDEFDKLALQINPKIPTGNRKLDSFFRKHFSPDTGMWIHKHPERNKLQQLYKRIRVLTQKTNKGQTK